MRAGLQRWTLGPLCAVSLWSMVASGAGSGEAPASTPPATASGTAQPAPPVMDSVLPGAKLSAGRLTVGAKGFVAGPEGATLELEQGARVRLDPGAELRFGRLFKMSVTAGPEGMLPTRVLTLQKGRLEASLLAPKHFALIISAPQQLGTLLVSGELTVLATPESSTTALLRGSALVTTAENQVWRPLPEGSRLVVNRRAPEGARHALLGAPGIPAPSRVLLLEGEVDEEGRALFSWPALDGALGYEVTVRGAGDTIVRRERVSDSIFSLGELKAGAYQVSVRGIDDSGLDGPESPRVQLRVVGLDIPKTAGRGPNGSVRLQEGQRVSLIGAEGLLVAYLGLDEFLPAPQSLGLVARRPISLVLLQPDTDERIHLTLEPLTARAQIAFSAHTATWPAEGLDVIVNLTDADGVALADDFAADCQVTVNVEPVGVHWARTGATLRAHLPHPTSAGPWMVRVEVTDENGAPLGMDFAEVGFPNSTKTERSAQR
jgi:hypothetical protein